MSTPPPSDPARLLEQSDWIRGLARKLVDDPNVADDLVQDAWVAALRAPVSARSPRGFLATVLRNLAREKHRGDARRDERERQAARPEAEPSPEALVAEVELQRRVAGAVLDLPEPLRTTVLLRFYRSMSFGAIAARQRVSTSTVHQRIARALTLLRKRLDEEHGGDRRAWALALLPFAETTGRVSRALGEVLVVTTAQKFAAVAVAAVGGILGIWYTTRAPEIAELPREELVVRTDETLEPPSEPLVEQEVELESRAQVRAAEKRPPAAAVVERVEGFDGRVIDVHGQPVGNVDVRLLGGTAKTDEPTVGRADAGGAFRLPFRENGQVVVEDERFGTIVAGVAPPADEPERASVVVVAPSHVVIGWVTNESAEPLQGVRIEIAISNALYRELGILRHWRSQVTMPETKTDAEGRFELRAVAGGRHASLHASHPGYELAERPLPDGDVTDLRIVLRRPEGPEVLWGTVVDAAGAPVEGAYVSWYPAVTRTDSEGKFRIAKPEEVRYYSDADGLVISGDGLSAIAEGYQAVVLEPERIPEPPIELVLGDPPLPITGRVVDADGEPVRAVVTAVGEAIFGELGEEVGEGTSVSWTVTREALARGDRRDSSVYTDEEGRFEIDGLEDRDYEIHAFDPLTLAAVRSVPIPAGTRSVELVLSEGTMQKVAGKILSLSGEPLPNIYVRPQRDFRIGTVPFGEWPMAAASTDADGRFSFDALAVESTLLTFQGESINFLMNHRLAELAEEQDLADLEIRLPRAARVQVDLAHRSADFASHFSLLDGEDEPIEASVFHANMMYMTPRVKIEPGKDSDGGKSPVVQADERARTLVLYSGDGEVLRIPVTLSGNEVTTIRP